MRFAEPLADFQLLRRLRQAALRHLGELLQIFDEHQRRVAQLDHVARVAGVDHVGLGSDFDGATMPDGMEDVSQLPKITDALLRRNYTEADIKKILGENTLRVMAEAERIAAQISREKRGSR